MEDADDARANPLRMDRRAAWRSSGASPFGFALRGRLPDDARAGYRLHEELGFPLWVHRDDDVAPERPLVVVLDLPGGSPRRPPTAPVNPGSLVYLRHPGPAPANAPPWTGPPCRWSAGPHRLEVVVDRGSAVEVTDQLSLLPG